MSYFGGLRRFVHRFSRFCAQTLRNRRKQFQALAIGTLVALRPDMSEKIETGVDADLEHDGYLLALDDHPLPEGYFDDVARGVPGAGVDDDSHDDYLMSQDDHPLPEGYLSWRQGS